MSDEKRHFTCKDVEVGVASLTIINSAIDNLPFLQDKRPNWASPYFENLKEKVEYTMKQYLGINNTRKLVEATFTVNNLQQQILKDVAEVKVQLMHDFKNNKPRLEQLLSFLGFTGHLAAAQKGDQESLMELLTTFKTNLDPALQAEITAAGTAEKSLNKILEYVDVLSAANVIQEGEKGNRPLMTTAGITALNEIYDEIIGVCTISHKFYKGEPERQDQFSFNKVVSRLNTGVKKATPPPTA